MQLYFFLYLLIINLLTFLIYGLDKWKSKHNKWRTPEKTLILLAAVGGSIGALAGMYLFRHKTRHAKFYLGIPAILILQVLVLGWIFYRTLARLY